MTAATACRTCGTEVSATAKFCSECGSPIGAPGAQAEYKQVTVLFADVVRSMDIAGAVGPERLREIMTQLVERSAAVVQRYGGTVDKFTGDGIMAVFGAPVALEDHAIRACLAALGIQEETAGLAVDIRDRDGIDLQVRVGLNSGQVIAGEVGSGALGYTAIGEQVGKAQRMESVAPAGGVMLSASTARLVEHHAVIAEPELVHIKGSSQPVAALRLLGMPDQDRGVVSGPSTMVGRRREMAAVEVLLGRAIDGHGAVVSVVGSPGIGKSRLVREITALAAAAGVEVFAGYCQSHTTDMPSYAVARLLRAATGVRGLDDVTARAQVQTHLPGAAPEDVLLFEDLLGIVDPEMKLPMIDPDARRRRMTALFHTTLLARETPAIYVIEDAHWIDEASEFMLASFLTVVPHTSALVLITYRPEYSGALSRTPGGHSIALVPLTDPETAALITELLGPDTSVGELGHKIAERAAGNPFFAEEIVRDLAERGVLDGTRGDYACPRGWTEVKVPATLEAAIAARIDRLDAAAKKTLNSAAVVGSTFDAEMVAVITDGEPDRCLATLVDAEFIDQIKREPRIEYVFRHPMLRTVAYESQLRSARVEQHQRIADVIQQRDARDLDSSAAVIAAHLEAAENLNAAFTWHMRAGSWSSTRDVGAARINWRHARDVATRLPANHPQRMAMRTAAQSLLCSTMWLAGGGVGETGFDELREMCSVNGDKASLAMGMAGQVMALAGHHHLHEASQLASELTALVDEIADPALSLVLLPAPIYAKCEVGELGEALRLAQQVIGLADGDPAKGKLLGGSPLIMATQMRGFTRMCLGIGGWRSDADAAITMAAMVEPTSYVMAIMYKYILAIPVGALSADTTAEQQTADALRIAEQTSDELTLRLAQLTRGLVLVHLGGSHREEGFALLIRAREAAVKAGFTMNALAIVDPEIAKEKARSGDLDGAIELSRGAIDDMFDQGGMLMRGVATMILVESLLQRGAEGDLQQAQGAIDRLAAVPCEPRFVLHELPLLRMRAFLAQAQGDKNGYVEQRDRYRAMAKSLAFEGHLKGADAKL
jgi:adenylate cyclase